MNIDIIIPSYLDIVNPQCMRLIDEIKSTRRSTGQLIFTGLKDSASKNRNLGLDKATSELVISIDDDIIIGDQPGWDEKFASDFLAVESNTFMMSARLLNQNGTYQDLNGDNKIYNQKIVYSNKDMCPSAMIIFRKNHLRYNLQYLGSSFEDSHFCMEYKRLDHRKRVAFDNEIKVVHLNQAKNQIPHVEHNKSVFFQHFSRGRRR